MRSTTTFATIFLMASCFANGLYLVSGGDFRPCNFKYVLETTTPNETVEVVPYRVDLCYTIGNSAARYSDYAKGSWMIKYDDNLEHDFGNTNCVRQNVSVSPATSGINAGTMWGNNTITPGCEVLQTFEHQYANPGRHFVKVFAPTWNIFNAVFKNTNIVELCIDWEECPLPLQYKTCSTWVYDCPNLVKLVYKNQAQKDGLELKGFVGLTSLKELKISHPENFTTLTKDVFASSGELESNLEFVNATNIATYAFRGCKKVGYLSIPNAQTIGGWSFFASATASDPSYGIKVLQLGDRLQSV